MLNVSAAWQKASREQFRFQAYLRAILEVTPPELRKNAVVASDATYKDSTIDSIMDHRPSLPRKLASLEPNRLVLDGNMNFMHKGDTTDDWWATSSNATVHFTFDKPYSVPGVYAEWDTENGSFPSSFTINGYNSSKQLVYNTTITTAKSATEFYKYEMQDVQYIDIVVNSWVNPNWCVRINEIMFGLYASFDSINNGRISGATITDTSDPLSNSLPTHEADVTLRNIDQYFDPTLKQGISQYLAVQQVMRLQWGFNTSLGVTEWSDTLTYFTENFKIPKDSKDVTFELTNRLTLTSGEFKLGTYTGTERTLFDIATYVLENSGMIREYSTQTPWVIPESFKNLKTKAPIPVLPVNSLLQLIASAGCSWLSFEGVSGFVSFTEPKTVASPFCAIEPAQELGDPEVKIIDRLRSIKISIYSYDVAAETTEVANSEYTFVGNKTIEISYNVPFVTNVAATVTGATLVSVEYYASYAILNLSAAITSTATIKLTGKELKQTVSYVETFRDANVGDGIDVTLENPLITDVSNITLISQFIAKYYNKRSRYSVPYLGYPQLEAVDRVHFATVYGTDDVDVASNTLKYNGGWSGTAEVI